MAISPNAGDQAAVAATHAAPIAAVRCDRALALRSLLLAALFLWPVALFGHAGIFEDTTSYFKGGRTAVAVLQQAAGIDASDRSGLEFRSPAIRSSPDPASSAQPSAKPSEAPGPAGTFKQPTAGRSVTYSVLVYLLRFPQDRLIALAGLQALFTGFVVACLAGAWGRPSGTSPSIRAILALGTALALLTPLAFEASFAMPDLLGGLMVAVMLLLAVEDRALSPAVKLALIAVGALGCAAHAGNPPLALLLAGAGGLTIFLRARENRIRRIVLLALPLVIGSLITIVTGFIAFKEVGIGAGHYPLALARSIDNGPGKLYLDKHCPVRRYAVCEVFDNHVPATIRAFLWEKDGLRNRATADQMRRIRAEEADIVWRAGLEHPVLAASQSVQDTWRQLHTFGLKMLAFDAVLVVGDDGLVVSKPTHQSLLARNLVHNLTMLSVIASLALVALRFGTWSAERRTVVLLLCLCLLANAAISAIFSGVTGRYQSRLIWLLPLVAVLFTWPRHRHQPTITGHAGGVRQPALTIEGY